MKYHNSFQKAYNKLEEWGIGSVITRIETFRKILQELVNTPTIKIPLWIESHKEELKELGIKIKER